MSIKKILVLGLAILVLSGCSLSDKKVSGKCEKTTVDLINYSDKGKQLENCFVEYPGEVTREDKSYYVVEDVCGQFTSKFISNALGKNIIKTENKAMDGAYACTYYWQGEKEYVSLILDYLEVEKQKLGQQALGRSVKEEKEITMRNMVAYQEDGLINVIYLILGPEKYLMIERSNTAGLTNNDLLNFAVNIAKEIKNYK